MVSSSTQTVEVPDPEVKPVETTSEPGPDSVPAGKPYTIKVVSQIPT